MNPSKAIPKSSTTPTTSIADKVKKVLSTDISLFSSKLASKDKKQFYAELSTLLTAGIDLKKSLEIIIAQQKKEKHKALFSGLLEGIIKGRDFNQVMDTEVFSLNEITSIRIGEQTGRLPFVLERLASHFEARITQQRKVTQALAYPVMILLTSFGAVAFMLLLIVPMFKDVFARLGKELPWMTQFIIELSEGLSSYFWIIIIGIVGISFLIFRLLKNPKYRAVIDSVLIKVPILGSFLKQVQLLKFNTTMSMLLASKLPLLKALELSSDICEFAPLKTQIDNIATYLRAGSPLHSAMDQTGFFPLRLSAMVKVGEETGRLADFFEKLSVDGQADLEHSSGLINTLLEPAIILFLGFVVGFILIAMYMPMFQLSGSF